jgi:hypothetical protein
MIAPSQKVWAIMTSVGVVVKYNPCSEYARLGKPCTSPLKPCTGNFRSCNRKEYDSWLKKALRGRILYFYPKRIRLLEIPGTVLVLYHCRRRRLVGEATITKATVENDVHKYWFEEFLAYPRPVAVAQLWDERGEPIIPHGGRWWLLYINARTLERIRENSGLDRETTALLSSKLDIAAKEVGRSDFRSTRGLFDTQAEMKKLYSAGVDPTILKKSEMLFSRAIKKGFVQGRSYRIMLYACLYLAYRTLGIPRRVDEIAMEVGLDERKLNSVVKRLVSNLEIKLPKTSPSVWVKYHSPRMGLSKKAIDAAISLVTQALGSRRLRGKSPRTIAATATYVACQTANAKITQKRIADAFGVSSATIRNLSKELCDMHVR